MFLLFILLANLSSKAWAQLDCYRSSSERQALESLSVQSQQLAACTNAEGVSDIRIYLPGERTPVGLREGALLVFDCEGAHLFIRPPRGGRAQQRLYQRIDTEIARLAELGALGRRGERGASTATAFSLEIGRGTRWTQALVRSRLRRSEFIFGRRASGPDREQVYVVGALGPVRENLLSEGCRPSAPQVRDDLAGLPRIPESIRGVRFRDYDLLPEDATSTQTNQYRLLSGIIARHGDRLLELPDEISRAVTRLQQECAGRSDGSDLANIVRACPEQYAAARDAITARCLTEGAISREFYSAGGSRRFIERMVDFMLSPGHSAVYNRRISPVAGALARSERGRQAELRRYVNSSRCVRSSDCGSFRSELRELEAQDTTACGEEWAREFLSGWFGGSRPSAVPSTDQRGI